MLILKRVGQPIHAIASFLGRSRSFVARILKSAFSFLQIDLRKIPARTKRLAAFRNRFYMEKTRAAWEAWILGEGEKPP